MRLNPTAGDRSGIPWVIAGTALFAVLVLVLWHYREAANPAAKLALKASRVDLVGRMQYALASASEAEKSAVLATTEDDARAFADQARAATAEVERGRGELGELLAGGGTGPERELLARFSEAFLRLRQVDEEVLGLAVKSSNLKAYALAYGPAAEAVAALDAALGRVIAGRARAPDALRVTSLASEARLGALRIQALLPPHIAEERDARMDELEAAMAREEDRARRGLDGLAAIPGLGGDADLAAAGAALDRYVEVKARILALSRENTNVRSLALSLDQKRKALTVCQETLAALQQAILDEPIAGVTYGRIQLPR